MQDKTSLSSRAWPNGIDHQDYEPPQVSNTTFLTPLSSDAEENVAAGPPPSAADRARETHVQSDTSRRAKAVKHRGRRRGSTFFPEERDADAIGAWRMTRVSGVGSDPADHDSESDDEQQCLSDSTWLLIGRRHSVDDRRGQVDLGKRFFLKNLADQVDAPCHSRAEGRAAELMGIEAQVRAEVERQGKLLAAATDFWSGSFAASRSYLTSLERLSGATSASLLPHGMAQSAADHIVSARKIVSRSEAWASWLPRVAACHSTAMEEILRSIDCAMTKFQTSTASWQAAGRKIWPISSELPQGDLSPLSQHSADSGPEDGRCLWLSACRYLVSCDNVEDSYQLALAQLHRQNKQASLLAGWLDDALSCSSSDCKDPPVMDVLHHQTSDSPHLQNTEAFTRTVELATLIVHELDAEVCRDYPRETSRDSVWVPVHLLLSVDLQLHIWEGAGMCDHVVVEPSESVQLLRDCNRPVAVRSVEDAQVVQMAVRPDANKSGIMANIERFLWSRSPSSVRGSRCGLQFRCSSSTEADELLSVFDIIEQLYPSACSS